METLAVISTEQIALSHIYLMFSDKCTHIHRLCKTANTKTFSIIYFGLQTYLKQMASEPGWSVYMAKKISCSQRVEPLLSKKGS